MTDSPGKAPLPDGASAAIISRRDAPAAVLRIGEPHGRLPSRVTIVKRRSALGASALLVAFGSASCADNNNGRDSSTARGSGADQSPSSQNDKSQDLRADPRSRKALRAAFVRLARANTGHFEVTIPLGGDAMSYEQGKYQLNSAAFSVVREFTGPGESISFAYRGEGAETWIRLESVVSSGQDTPAWPCWVSHDDIASQDAFPPELVGGPTGQPPSAVVAASYGIGQRTISTSIIEGTIDLALTLGLMGGKVVMAAGIDVQADDTVPATFLLDADTLTGFSVALADLPEAVEAAGGDLPPELDGLSAMPGSIEARFYDIGESVDIAPPPPDEQLEFTDADDFEASMNSCGQ